MWAEEKAMGTKLRRMLEKHRDKLVASIVTELRSSDEEQFQQMDSAVLEERTNHLVDEFLEAMANKAETFTEYILRLTEERMAEGDYLSEIRTALNTLSEKACDLAMKHSDADKVDKHLLRIWRTINQAKDELVHTYYLGKRQAESRLRALEGPRESSAGSRDAPEPKRK
jgi:hypothetical protein